GLRLEAEEVEIRPPPGEGRLAGGDQVGRVGPGGGDEVPRAHQHQPRVPQVEMYLIEVQTGAYLGEDDITRFEDAYDRL
ncbi:MAG: hypothetical protein AAFR40_18805, partial [Pseudomonadota bacterium]